MTDLLAALFILVGSLFYAAGSLALIRFPDLFSRLHAITKADNVGLGLLVLGLVFQSANLTEGLKLVLIWMSILPASAAAGHLIALWALDRADCIDQTQGKPERQA